MLGNTNAKQIACSSIRSIESNQYPPSTVYFCLPRGNVSRLDTPTDIKIWLQDGDGNKAQVAGDAVQDFEPLYGPTYLPRKFALVPERSDEVDSRSPLQFLPSTIPMFTLMMLDLLLSRTRNLEVYLVSTYWSVEGWA